MADTSILPYGPPVTGSDQTGTRNMLVLTHLRWIAVAGQLATILFVHLFLHVGLPIVPMIAVATGLAALNAVTLIVLARGRTVANWELFVALLVDFAALTAQLYMSGGATNPFAPIGLLQVVIGAVLLAPWSSYALVALHSAAFGLLAIYHRELVLPEGLASTLSPAHLLASWVNFVLAAVLLVFFVTRIGRNLRMRDASLAEMRQRAAEEDHIVRMGLLASGAAHELGTPLSSLSVILGDWRKQPSLARDAALSEEIVEMQAAVARCKEIVGGILYASGEARSEDLERTTLRAFILSVADQWRAQRPGLLFIADRLGGDTVIAADRTLAQILTNVLDNAAEAGATRVDLIAERSAGVLLLTVRDDGRGFPAEMLEGVGKPYRSTKDRRGAGLGLFLAVNVMRTLGGSVAVRNAPGRGAEVELSLPLDALALEQTA
ncbi:HAMP domain-containing histidine kinase [Sphingomonas aliaeris]|uniref:histidine kinase n=1 Tax=Sphingomonas aliaeris TaxID=2759526 RepID=A0A974NTS7_9SPHN|nr:ATP-binding protein [Sphingomonas aliaeris]QQV76761.1 HAMP domain-containing histidine kinase [Sphingomonas aliaeris]